jgi:methyl-accepting chemotaxis protein
VDLETRLRLLQITDDTKHNLRMFVPTLVEHMGEIVRKFYNHILSFPEAKKIFSSEEQIAYLHTMQKKHWVKMFRCDFDEAYVDGTFAIGEKHYQYGVAPYLYIAGYNFFVCEVIRVASAHYGASLELPGVLASIVRVVNLDMDIALSAYTRAHWTRTSG